MFYRGMSTPHEQAVLQASNLWPAIVATLNESEGRLQVGQIIVNSYKQVQSVEMVTDEGLRVCSFSVINNNPVEYVFNTISDPDSNGNGWARLKTKRVKYMASRIRKKDSETNRELRDQILSASKFFNKKLGEVFENIFHKHIEQPRWSSSRVGLVSMETSLSTLLLRLVKNDITYHEIGAAERALIDNKFNELKKGMGKLTTAYSAIEEFFYNDKWCLISHVNQGFLVGAISNQPMLAAVAKMRADNTSEVPDSDSFSYAHKIVPFGWYKSLSDLPDAMRKDIELQLTMLKTHRNVQELFPTNTEGGHSFDMWTDVGACCKGNWSESKFILIDKQG